MENNNVTATKEFTWDMAHVLAGHEGLCRNLHGHTYKLEVTVARLGAPTVANGPAKGMVIDFKELKEIVKALIVDPLDHATMIDNSSDDEFEKALSGLLGLYHKKHVHVNYRPTAENMVVDFDRLLTEEFGRKRIPLEVVRLRLYETPTSYAEIIK